MRYKNPTWKYCITNEKDVEWLEVWYRNKKIEVIML